MIKRVCSSTRVSGRRLATVSAACVALACVGCASITKPTVGSGAAVSQPVHTPTAAASATTMPAATVGPPANPVASPNFGAFASWAAAQTAAGFGLLQPASTNGLPLANGGIQVGQCAGDSAHANVWATYAAGADELAIDQDDEPGPQGCSNIGEASSLGTYTVDGVQAQLLGACGTAAGEPSCNSPSLWLFLVWTVGSDRSYQVMAHNESPAQVVAFAQGLSDVN
jgi:hypothetical protein